MTARKTPQNDDVLSDQVPPEDPAPESAMSTDERIAELERRVREAEARAAQNTGEEESAAPWPPLTTVPEHGAGPGLEVAETWCQAYQTEARLAAD